MNLDKHIGLPLLFALALIFFGCDNGGGDGGDLSSSSSDIASSSSLNSEYKYAFCVFFEYQTCLSGSFSSCEGGGLLSQTCPFNSGSSSVEPSSSSLVPSSSSIVEPWNSSNSEASSSSLSIPSSSSIVPSSSSVEPSSSSLVPSSSSIVPSSSSLTPSSSSAPPALSSSSSVVPSSSSVEPSSSSLVPSSSSIVPSSSSLTPSSSSSSTGSLTESSSSVEVVYGESVIYEGETYQTVVIGTQTWFARNLNYAAEGSKCYNNEPANCATYGRLYDWSTAMALPSDCNYGKCAGQIGEKHRGICPTGWHIPTNADWDKLYRYADGTSETSSPYTSPTAGTKLKASSGWNSYSSRVPAGQDTYGFAALPGGYGDSDGGFDFVGYDGYWWSATEYSANRAYYRSMYYGDEYASGYYNYKDTSLRSVRCVQD